MKKITKFSLAAVVVLACSSSAYARTIIQIGDGSLSNIGVVLPTGTPNAITMNVTGTNTLPGYTAGANTLNVFAVDTSTYTIPTTTNPYTVNIYAQNGTNISGDMYVYTGGTFGTPGTSVLSLDSTGAGIGYFDAFGNPRGVFVDGTGTTINNDLYMDNNQIHGLAPGTLGTDAVNLNQLNGTEKSLSKGIAATAALANIPQVDQGKTYSFGIGYGNYNSENAVALGGSWRFNNDGIFKASVGTGGSGETTVGAGAAWSW